MALVMALGPSLSDVPPDLVLDKTVKELVNSIYGKIVTTPHQTGPSDDARLNWSGISVVAYDFRTSFWRRPDT